MSSIKFFAPSRGLSCKASRGLALSPLGERERGIVTAVAKSPKEPTVLSRLYLGKAHMRLPQKKQKISIFCFFLCALPSQFPARGLGGRARVVAHGLGERRACQHTCCRRGYFLHLLSPVQKTCGNRAGRKVRHTEKKG